MSKLKSHSTLQEMLLQGNLHIQHYLLLMLTIKYISQKRRFLLLFLFLNLFAHFSSSSSFSSKKKIVIYLYMYYITLHSF